MMRSTLYYIYDPMCSWCWAFSPTWEQIKSDLPRWLTLSQLLGGLAVDTKDPMPIAMQHKIRTIWQTIEKQVPGTQFNYDFWSQCRPRRSTYMACRAVIAASRQNPDIENQMIFAIQQAYYLQAQNPSEQPVLVALAQALKLNHEQFASDLNARETQVKLQNQISLGRKLGAKGFPSLILNHLGRVHEIEFDYNIPEVALRNTYALE